MYYINNNYEYYAIKTFSWSDFHTIITETTKTRTIKQKYILKSVHEYLRANYNTYISKIDLI